MNILQPTQIQVSAYKDKSKGAILSAPSNLQLALVMMRAFNRSGGACDVGIVRRFSSASFSLYLYDGTSAYAQVSTLPLAGAHTATIIATGTANNGFVIQSKYKSGIIGFTISQASASGVYTYQYWDGSAWQTLTTLATAVFTATGDNVVAFLPPQDWAVGGDAGLNQQQYSIRVRGTTAPATAIQINDLWCGQMLDFYAAVANNAGVNLEFDAPHPLLLEAGEGIMPYFSVAAAGNGMTVAYQTT